MKSNLNNFMDKIKESKFIQIIIIGLIFGALGLTYFFQTNAQGKATDDVSVYISTLESKLKNDLSLIENVGKVDVIITVEGGNQTVLAMKTTTTKNNDGVEIVESPVIVNGKTVVLQTLYPKICGVLIIADGADNIMTYNKIQQATVSLLNIDCKRIEIMKRK